LHHLIDDALPGMPPTDSETTTDSNTGFGDAVSVGVHQAGQMLREVAFPDFCSSLIEGVFHSIVKSSIEQMKAYGDLVNSVAQSLSDFKDQNTTANQGRDHLVSKYPNIFQVNVSNGQPSVGAKPGADMLDMLPNFKQDLGLDTDVSDLDNDTIENVLVPAAQMDLARGRQKLLATTILMGINRIVVTDGNINAKLKFTFSASDQKVTTDQATKYDHGFGDQFSDQGGMTPTLAVSDLSDSQSQAVLQAGGSISGEVNINFKSDVVPLEKLINTDQIQLLNAAQSGAGRAAPAPAPAAAAPAAAGPATPPAATAPAAAPPATAPAAAPAPAAG
jgi:hypothetical protein